MKLTTIILIGAIFIDLKIYKKSMILVENLKVSDDEKDELQKQLVNRNKLIHIVAVLIMLVFFIEKVYLS